MAEPLPEFLYHRDPVATGTVVPSDATCTCCGRERGYVYTGPVYAIEDLTGRLCPWCIADGSAAERYDAHFTAGICLGDDVSLETFRAVDERTPGFSAWQEPRWFFHCGDGAVFLGRAGAAELAAHPDALESLRQEMNGWGWSPEDVEHHLDSLDEDDQPTAYLFRCRSCATHLAYSDFT